MATKTCNGCGLSYPATTEWFGRVKGSRLNLQPVCRMCASTMPVSAARGFVTASRVPPANALPRPHALHTRLCRMQVNDCLAFGRWRVIFDAYNYIVSEVGVSSSSFRVYTRRAAADFVRSRAASRVLSDILCADAAPELRYKNITRRGLSFEAWHLEKRIVARASTPQAAVQDYEAWRQQQRGKHGFLMEIGL